MARLFERRLFDLIENVSRAERRGAFSRALADGLHREFGESLRVVAAGEFRPQDGRYELTYAVGAPLWHLADGLLTVRSLQRRLKDQYWWVQRGLKQDGPAGPLWYDLLLLPIGHDLNHVLGLITQSLAGEEGQDREAQFQILSQLIRLFVDRHHQQARLTEILTLAREQQMSLLQPQLPPVKGFRVAGLSIPAEEVGGDYYQLIALNRRQFAVAVADAKGHGFEAAVLVTALHAALRVVNELPFKLTHKVRLLNRSLAEKGELRNLVTLFYAEFEEQGRLIYANCSHPPGLLVRANALDELQTGGIFLGLDAETEYHFGVAEMAPGDLLVLYTDGWSELFNDRNEELGGEGIRDLVRGCHGMSPETVVERIQAGCDKFRGELPYTDDRTLLVIRKE